MSNDISIHDVSDDIDDMIKDNVESVGLTEKEKSYQAKPKAKTKAKAKAKFGEAQPKLEGEVDKSYMTPEEIEEIDNMSPAEVERELAMSKAKQVGITSKPGSSIPEWKNVPQPKTMGNTDQSGCRDNVPDVVMFGDDLFKLMSKASSEVEGWMKSTKAMEVGRGCVVQVTTQQRNPDGSYSVAEALSFVPGVRLVENKNASGIVTGRRLR